MDNNKRIYAIRVSEPWDFESPDGNNVIKGIILSIVNKSLLVFRTNNLLSFDGVNGDILILSPRFKEESFEHEVTKEIIVNGGLFLGNYDKSYEENKLKENSKFVLIGKLYN